MLRLVQFFSPFVYWEYCVKCLRISIVFKNKANIKFKLVSDVYLARVRHLSNIHATKSHVPLVCCLLREKNIFPGGIGGGRKFFGNSRGVGGLPLLPQNGKSEGVGGSYMKFPPWWGYGYFLELHNVIFSNFQTCWLLWRTFWVNFIERLIQYNCVQSFSF